MADEVVADGRAGARTSSESATSKASSRPKVPRMPSTPRPAPGDLVEIDAGPVFRDQLPLE